MRVYEIAYIGGLLAVLTVPIFSASLVRKRRKDLFGFCIVVILSSLIMSAYVGVQWVANNWYLEHHVAELDRNGDGFISGDERDSWTEEDRRTMDAYIGDGGRNVFAAFIFPIFSTIYSLAIASGYWILAAIFRRRKHA